MKSIVILISGRGSNMQALIEAALPVRIAAVISNNPDAAGLEIAKKHNIETIYHTAAYKHVPLVEKNTIAGIRCNIFGTLACCKAAINGNVKTLF